MPNKPTAGEVFRYPFLWKREELSGETEGRKKRPVCIAVTVAKQDGETMVFIQDNLADKARKMGIPVYRMATGSA